MLRQRGRETFSKGLRANSFVPKGARERPRLMVRRHVRRGHLPSQACVKTIRSKATKASAQGAGQGLGSPRAEARGADGFGGLRGDGERAALPQGRPQARAQAHARARNGRVDGRDVGGICFGGIFWGRGVAVVNKIRILELFPQGLDLWVHVNHADSEARGFKAILAGDSH